MNRMIFLSPHYDDETLFGAFHILSNPGAHVVVCFVPANTGDQEIRVHEFAEAMSILDATWEEALCGREKGASPFICTQILEQLRDKHGDDATYYAPMWEPWGGNEDHNLLSVAADRVFSNVVHYSTYSWPNGKTTTDHPVEIDPLWVPKKLRAMTCYKSQIERDETYLHFVRDLNEYTYEPRNS